MCHSENGMYSQEAGEVSKKAGAACTADGCHIYRGNQLRARLSLRRTVAVNIVAEARQPLSIASISNGDVHKAALVHSAARPNTGQSGSGL